MTDEVAILGRVIGFTAAVVSIGVAAVWFFRSKPPADGDRSPLSGLRTEPGRVAKRPIPVVGDAGSSLPVPGPVPVVDVVDGAVVMPHGDVAFGYKCGWLAIRANDSESVARALDLREVQEATWADGLRDAHAGSYFVTPPISGWVLVVSTDWLARIGTDAALGVFLAQLSGRLSCEVQLFGTHRVSEFHAWMRAVHGDLRRAYACSGERGEVLFDSGAPTDDELRLGVDFDPDPNPLERRVRPLEGESCASEEDVIRLASMWSVDPTVLSEEVADVRGLLGCGPGVVA